MQTITVLLPGLLDVPLDDLNGKTPLETARAPLLQDAPLASPSACQGLGSALLDVLQAPPVAESVLEALALGIRLRPGQHAFSARLISQGEGVVVDVSDQLAGSREAEELYKFLNAQFGCSFLSLGGTRAVMITEDSELCQLPPNPFLNPVDCLGKSLNTFSRSKLLDEMSEVLQGHSINDMRADLEEDPVNGLLISDGGSAQNCFIARRDSAVFIGRTGVLLGAAKWAGWETIRLAAEEQRFDHIAKIFSLLPQLDAEEVMIEIPYLWDATYKGDLLEKIKTLEWLDRHLIAKMPAAKLHPLVQVDIRQGRILPASLKSALDASPVHVH